MNKKRINTARDRRVARATSQKFGICVVSTDEGVKIELGDDPNGVTLDLGIDKAIEVAATLMVAILPAAAQEGKSLEVIGEQFWMLLTEKCQAVHTQLDEMPS